MHIPSHYGTPNCMNEVKSNLQKPSKCVYYSIHFDVPFSSVQNKSSFTHVTASSSAELLRQVPFLMAGGLVKLHTPRLVLICDILRFTVSGTISRHYACLLVCLHEKIKTEMLLINSFIENYSYCSTPTPLEYVLGRTVSPFSFLVVVAVPVFNGSTVSIV